MRTSNAKSVTLLSKSIEHYDLWVEEVEKQDIPENLKTDFNKIGHLLITHIYRKSMRKIIPEKLESWVRSRYSANVDERVIQKDFIIANQVGKFITSHGEEFDISLSEIKKVIELDNILEKEENKRREKMMALKSEIEALREEKRKARPRSPRRSKAKKTTVKVQEVSTEKSTSKSKVDVVTQDMVYKEWMKHVEEKSTSKSYWYIHEYIARFILKWAREHGDGTITTEVVESFLTDYGKGKADKTMNHYNRVSRYFLEFCEEMYKNAGV